MSHYPEKFLPTLRFGKAEFASRSQVILRVESKACLSAALISCASQELVMLRMLYSVRYAHESSVTKNAALSLCCARNEARFARNLHVLRVEAKRLSRCAADALYHRIERPGVYPPWMGRRSIG